MTATRWGRIDRLGEDLGDLIAKNQRSRGNDYHRFADDPVGFIRDVLGSNPWGKQIEIALAVRDNALVTVRSAHASGKDWLACRLALWWVYARNGLVILTGPTASQIEEICMRSEVRSAFLAGNLPGELHVRALRPRGDGEAGILARTGSDTHALTGLHRSRVLYIITEAQDPDIDHAWDASFACCTGEEDRILTLGNPTEPDGRFYQAHRPDSAWHKIKIGADDIPNVQQRKTVVPGLLTADGVARFVTEYGDGSQLVQSRVHAEFPSEASDSLVTVAWWDFAVELHKTNAFAHTASENHVVVGCDPARLGADATVMCVRRGPVVHEFIEWRGADTMQTADRIEAEVRRLMRDLGGVEAVYSDEIGLGAGVVDRLGETLPRLGWVEYNDNGRGVNMVRHHVRSFGFSASKQAGLPARFVNMRSQAYWQLRKLMEDRRIALPNLPELREELLATRVRFGSDGRTSIEPKDAVKARLGRSPDRLDALVISLAPMLERADRKPQAMWA